MRHLIGTISNCTAADCESKLRSEFRRVSEKVQASEQQLQEVVNQMATVERLLDCLKWVNSRESEIYLPWVMACRPMTSSSRDEFDDDLVLSARDSNRVVARFECSDIITARANNGKLTKDADSLFRKCSANEQLFIVTSCEGAEAFAKIEKIAGTWRLRGEPSARTRIIEITKAA